MFPTPVTIPELVAQLSQERTRHAQELAALHREVARLVIDLRDEFAKAAVIGILSSEANPSLAEARLKIANLRGRSYEQQLAVEAFQLADALVAEREKKA